MQPKSTPKSETAQSDLAEKNQVMERLKEELNSFLWTRLPPSMSLAAAETVACRIVDLIECEWESRS